MSIRKQKIVLLVLLITALFSFSAAPYLAQARGLVPCGGYKDDAGTQREPPCDIRYAFIMVAQVTNWLIMVAGIYAVFQIVNAGFWLVTTMGNEETITKYRKGISNAVVGFVLVMMAFIIVNTALNAILLNLNLSSNPNNSLRIDFTQPLCYLNSSASGCIITSSPSQ